MLQIAIYAPQESPRLTYILNYLTERLGVPFIYVNNFDGFQNFQGVKINYSHEIINCYSINPHSLLFEDDIHTFDFSKLLTDPFAYIFFLISRYEEYIQKERDQHGRFQAKSSFLFAQGELQTPVVDKLIQELKDELIKVHPQLTFKEEKYETQLTVDIDQAFLFKGKSLKRFIGGSMRDALNVKLNNMLYRKLSFFGFKQDPYDVYDLIKNKFINAHNKPIFFFQVGNYGAFDKNLDYRNNAFQKVIREVSEWTKLGLHPSYASNDKKEILDSEKKRMTEILLSDITLSRQHYIKLKLPNTYRNLIKIGIADDYTMGFTDDIGFRAGTSRSFLWYDLPTETETNLRVHPFSVMDVTLKNYLNLSTEEADIKVRKLQNNLKQLKGKFMIICHNESLSNYGEWKSWREIFLKWFED